MGSKIVRSFLLSVALAVPVLGGAASFEGITDFAAIPIQGDMTLICNDGFQQEIRSIRCTDVILDPFEMGYFNAEKDLGADELVLVSQRADGERVEKKTEYDSANGKSVKRINLWINTLFQTSLLDVGVNPVSYELKAGGEIKASGQFNVNVTLDNTAYCPRSTEHSGVINDCRFPNYNVCNRYFRSWGYCLGD